MAKEEKQELKKITKDQALYLFSILDAGVKQQQDSINAVRKLDPIIAIIAQILDNA
jgi:hypothetical protein